RTGVRGSRAPQLEGYTMFTRFCIGSVVLLGVSTLLLIGPQGRTQEFTEPPAGVEVLARGPVHEAYADVVDTQPQPGRVVPQEPPAPIEEQPPAQKPDGENVQWIGGYWNWDEERGQFVWVSGLWRVPPPGRQWTPGFWQKVEGGWQWISGHWAPAEQDQTTVLPPPPAPVVTAPPPPAPD